MRALVVLFMCAIVCDMTSCATVMLGETRVYGRIQDVSMADVQAAVDADRVHTSEKIYEIEVLSASEMHLYHEHRADTLNYDIVKRVAGRWKFIEATGFVT